MKVSFPNKLFLCAAALAVGILGDIKIHAQSGGVPLWTNRYHGPENGQEIAVGVAVDSIGNVVVTGTSVWSRWHDYATIKYSNAGVPLWTNRYDGPDGPTGSDYASAVAVDGSDNVIVTGSSQGGGSLDYATIKYSSAGVALWTNRYGASGLGIGDDIATALAVDSSGNVFVTGNSTERSWFGYATIAYSSAGVPLWTNRYNEPGAYGESFAYAVAVDGSGNVFVTGSGSSDANSNPCYATIKYSGDGEPLWTNRFRGPLNDDVSTALAVDRDGNVFVTGRELVIAINDTRYDYVTIKYSNGGVPLWTNRYDGPGNSDDRANAVTVDGSGNVFVAGSSGDSWGGASSADYVTIKYSNAGVPLWTNRYGGPGDSVDAAYSLAVDSSGNVFVMGYCDRMTNIYPYYTSYATVAYSSAGVPLWTNRFDGPGNSNDRAKAVAVDRSGNVFVTGALWPSDYVTIKYSSMGGPLLTIARTTTNTLAVSWPSPAADFTLQQSTNAATTNWTPVGNTPADDGTNKTVIVDPPDGNKFYRLFHP